MLDCHIFSFVLVYVFLGSGEDSYDWGMLSGFMLRVLAKLCAFKRHEASGTIHGFEIAKHSTCLHICEL